MNMAPRGKNVKKRKFQLEQVEKALVKTIIINQLPFSVVEKEGFKERMEAVFPGFHIPSPEMISTDCSDLFMDEKSKLKSLIKRTNQRVSLSLDTYTSNQSVNYLCITAHFIDDNWNSQKKVIGFTPICSDEGEEIGKVVENCLNEWEIDNVLTISTGKGSSSDDVVTYLRGRLTNGILDGKFLHLKYVDDFIVSFVKVILNKCEDIITRVRAAVTNVLQSPYKIKKFKKYAKKNGIESDSFLSLDCPTSWTSTFKMMKSAKTFWVVLHLSKAKDPTYKHRSVWEDSCWEHCHSDWKKLKKVVGLLKCFYRLTEITTSNMFLDEIINIHGELHCWRLSSCNYETRYFESLERKWKFYEYWGDVEKSNMLIYVAFILDPRRKMRSFENYFLYDIYENEYTDEGVSLWKKKVEWVFSATYDLFNEYLNKIGGPQQNAKFETSGYKQYLYEDRSHVELYPRHTIGLGGNEECKTEIDIYLSDLTEVCSEDWFGLDVLVWWNTNSERFPILSKMAKDILSIPFILLAPESDFSAKSNLLDDFRSSLPPEIVEGLVCTQDWIRKSRKQIKLEEGLPNLDHLVKGMYEQLDDFTS